jgi:hypothetical protein
MDRWKGYTPCLPSRRSHKGDHVLSVLAAPVAQTGSLSVSVQIVAGRANFPERGCVRSTSRSTLVVPAATRCGWVFDHSRAPFWSRLRRAGLYRRFLTNCVQQKICFERATPFSLPLLLKRRRGPGRGGAFYQFPLSPALSPPVPRGERESKRRNPEHNWFLTCEAPPASGVLPITNRRYGPEREESNVRKSLKRSNPNVLD